MRRRGTSTTSRQCGLRGHLRLIPWRPCVSDTRRGRPTRSARVGWSDHDSTNGSLRPGAHSSSGNNGPVLLHRRVRCVRRATQPRQRRVTQLWLTLRPRLLRLRLLPQLLRPGQLRPMMMMASLTSLTQPRQRCVLRSIGCGGRWLSTGPPWTLMMTFALCVVVTSATRTQRPSAGLVLTQGRSRVGTSCTGTASSLRPRLRTHAHCAGHPSRQMRRWRVA